ncbi:MAG: DNA-3-methyladenine glycosylase [Armatimonadota bacterium]
MNDEIRGVLRLYALEAAPLVLGLELSVGACSGRIVEVEAYTQNDPASHSYRGRTQRNAPMFLSGGHIYVYRSYGVHWCLNLVTGEEGQGEALLVRAIEPTAGVAVMRRRRGPVAEHRLCAGPGNVCRALGVDGSFSGQAIGRRVLLGGAPGQAKAVVRGRRIGITHGADLPWRFCLAGSRFLSRPAPKTAGKAAPINPS